MRVDFAADTEGSLSLLIDHVEMTRWPADEIPVWTNELKAQMTARDNLT